MIDCYTVTFKLLLWIYSIFCEPKTICFMKVPQTELILVSSYFTSQEIRLGDS